MIDCGYSGCDYMLMLNFRSNFLIHAANYFFFQAAMQLIMNILIESAGREKIDVKYNS